MAKWKRQMKVNTHNNVFMSALSLPLLPLCHLAVCLEGFGELRKTRFSGTLSIAQLALMQTP